MHKTTHMVVKVFETLFGVKKIHMQMGKTFTLLETPFASKTQLKNLKILGMKLFQTHNPKQSLKTYLFGWRFSLDLVTLLELFPPRTLRRLWGLIWERKQGWEWRRKWQREWGIWAGWVRLREGEKKKKWKKWKIMKWTPWYSFFNPWVCINGMWHGSLLLAFLEHPNPCLGLWIRLIWDH